MLLYWFVGRLDVAPRSQCLNERLAIRQVEAEESGEAQDSQAGLTSPEVHLDGQQAHARPYN